MRTENCRRHHGYPRTVELGKMEVRFGKDGGALRAWIKLARVGKLGETMEEGLNRVGGTRVVRGGVRILQLGGQVRKTRKRNEREDRSWVDGTAKGAWAEWNPDVEWMGGKMVHGGGRVGGAAIWRRRRRRWRRPEAAAAAAAAGRQHSGKS